MAGFYKNIKFSVFEFFVDFPFNEGLINTIIHSTIPYCKN